MTFSACLFCSETADKGCHGSEEKQTEPEESPCDTEGETSLSQNEPHVQESRSETQVCGR